MALPSGRLMPIYNPSSIVEVFGCLVVEVKVQGDNSLGVVMQGYVLSNIPVFLNMAAVNLNLDVLYYRKTQ